MLTAITTVPQAYLDSHSTFRQQASAKALSPRLLPQYKSTPSSTIQSFPTLLPRPQIYIHPPSSSSYPHSHTPSSTSPVPSLYSSIQRTNPQHLTVADIPIPTHPLAEQPPTSHYPEESPLQSYILGHGPVCLSLFEVFRLRCRKPSEFPEVASGELSGGGFG